EAQLLDESGIGIAAPKATFCDARGGGQLSRRARHLRLVAANVIGRWTPTADQRIEIVVEALGVILVAERIPRSLSHRRAPRPGQPCAAPGIAAPWRWSA